MRLNLNAEPYPGVLITFCGLDGCGKTTMIRRLQQYLIEHGRFPVLTKQPTDLIRQMKIFRTFMDEPNNRAYEYRSLSLLAAGDRVQHANRIILPQLQSGQIVISDRYFYSCFANLQARGYTADRWIYEIAEHIPKPDLAIFLDTEVKTAVSRVRQRPAEAENWIDMPLQEKLSDLYRKIASDCGGLLISSETSEEQTFQEFRYAIQPVLRKKGFFL